MAPPRVRLFHRDDVYWSSNLDGPKDVNPTAIIIPIAVCVVALAVITSIVRCAAAARRRNTIITPRPLADLSTWQNPAPQVVVPQNSVGIAQIQANNVTVVGATDPAIVDRPLPPPPSSLSPRSQSQSVPPFPIPEPAPAHESLHSPTPSFPYAQAASLIADRPVASPAPSLPPPAYSLLPPLYQPG